MPSDSMFSTLTDEQRRSIDENGTPLPFFDDATNASYVLLPIEYRPDSEGGFLARIPSIDAFGSGETEQEAALALAAALRAYIAAFS